MWPNGSGGGYLLRILRGVDNVAFNGGGFLGRLRDELGV